jgi:hypothetical protein
VGKSLSGIPALIGSRGARFGQTRIDQEFSYLPIRPAMRYTIEKGAKIRARALVVQEKKAILALTEALVENDGSLAGDAMRVVNEYLSGNTFYLAI